MRLGYPFAQAARTPRNGTDDYTMAHVIPQVNSTRQATVCSREAASLASPQRAFMRERNLMREFNLTQVFDYDIKC